MHTGEGFRDVIPQGSGIHQFFHGVLAPHNLAWAHERLLKPAADQSLAHSRFRLIQHPEQRSLLFLCAHCFQQFQIPAGVQIEPHKLGPAVKAQLRHALQACALRSLQITEQRAERSRDQRLILEIKRFQALSRKLLLYSRRSPAEIVFLLREEFQTRAEPLSDKSGQFPQVKRRRIHQNFTRRKTGQLIDHLLIQILALQCGGAEISCGNVGKTAADFLFRDTERTDKIIPGFVQHASFQHRAGRDNANDIALDEALGQRRVLHLLADGNLISFLHEAGDVCFRAMKRHAAHGSPLLLAAVTPSQRKIQLAGHQFGVIEKHLIKISEPEKQDGAGILLFD